ncbi:hypothetical protein A3A76_05605 [Candidatus Woesebacteria bacterium RIFCSPLOWO2_01_FULL_39_23]|uniref:TGS domain-containing protein n=1 Tax=Candidatus Woesebacteria bacterium RIFCSPHIGHO2_01_FULL_40_22 TaxID=1802499 RepID=A0A1F7YL50_9BACT|nr:MAG: hypothetical protein A2141_03705 [Candidatus Woesebacteria bacterium RBG_16_40_11]OGM27930.1 MAG: hypothetical protein A2628_03530 [Candidatus Woesebacteria bacterium RIFCSPHIGHO2_01_FULL_40_22]OGM37534.1 MAG: hypothetical protein A3E41_01755 [Candidatus Woesebacteria bacterium RIFCSPHIGHO2_12_FULL_38_9]OGM61686.1 MAG: hypothetical protein A3A76_05605 [Candidatus Woesebacteria bacterium RIFCSPLOWO2_01_FULL_39_23]
MTNGNKIDLEGEYGDVKSLLRQVYPDGDLKRLDRAWEFTKLAHTGQKRLTGEPYALHELATARILAGWKMDLVSITSGLLHDAIEDGGAKREDIVAEFGEEVALLVDGVTKISNLKLRESRNEFFVENLRKMFLAMAKDLRVVFIKLADRLHNMQTLYALPQQKQLRIAKETLEIFAPLADRLGMSEVAGDMKDLAFPYIYPAEFKEVQKESKLHYKEVTKLIKKMKRSLLAKLADEGMRANIQAREKHLYSLWRKLERPEIKWDFEKIHDIVAMRILVDTVSECYTALGVVHRFYKPVPHLGISDFIAQPKPNGYRSIHTKVFGPGGKIVEVQIRTWAMHDQAEYGLSAHWAYDEAKKKKVSDEFMEKVGAVAPKDKLSWVRQLVDWQKEIKDSEEYMEAVKFDALNNRIFVFSPKGDVYELPKSATPVDYAFAVHTDLGKYIKSAKVNGKIVPLKHNLNSGDIVEIVKSKNPHPPSPSWLDFVVTLEAKKEINSYLRTTEEKV